MKLEGVAEIELTNVHTGEKERYVEKNMVTNALQHIFGKNYGGGNATDLLPLIDKGLSGILIFDGTIQEDPNIVIAPGNVNCIGHAGNSVYSGEATRRGSKNAEESKRLADGAKLVWDFATHQGNGTIKCIALTSSMGGDCGLGEESKAASGISFIAKRSIKSQGYYYRADGKYLFYSSSRLEDIKPQNGVITINKYLLPLREIRLTVDFNNNYKKLGAYNYDVGIDSSVKWKFGLDGSIAYLLGVKLTTNKTTVYIQEINKETMEAEKRTVEIQQNIRNDKLMLYDNKLYSFGSKTYIVDLKNPTDIVEINTEGSVSNAKTFKIGDRVYYGGGNDGYVISSNGNVSKFIDNYIGNAISANDAAYSLDGINYIISPDSLQDLTVAVYVPYLATINNLATPVIKTADKTMKITYTIREKLE